MAFKKGQSGNPGGRPVIRLADGRSLTDLAREHTAEAVETLVDVMRNGESDAARVAASTQILNRGWGQAPQTIAVTDDRQPRDLSGMTDEQLEALETLRTLDALDGGVAGSC